MVLTDDIADKVMEHVPGTTRYFDDPERPQAATSSTAGLKCDTSGSVPIILVPQPSDDPNDPLVCFGSISLTHVANTYYRTGHYGDGTLYSSSSRSFRCLLPASALSLLRIL